MVCGIILLGLPTVHSNAAPCVFRFKAARVGARAVACSVSHRTPAARVRCRECVRAFAGTEARVQYHALRSIIQ